MHEQKLRFFTAEGQFVSTPAEDALLEQQQRVDAESRAATAEALLERYRQQFGDLPET